MVPPAIDLAGSDPFSGNINLEASSRSRSRSSEEERENTDGAVEEFTAGGGPASGGAPNGNRPRGRPPGSKNKPKTPSYLSVDPQEALRSHVMEVSSGADISSSLASYARTRGRGVSVLHAVGSVAGVKFRPHSSPDPLYMKGKLDIISLSGTVLPDNTSLGPAGLTVFVSGPHGQVMGGSVAGRLVAEGAVMVIAASFSSATYEKLPLQVGRPEEVPPAGLVGPTQILGQGPGQPIEDPRSAGYYPGYNMNMEMNRSSPSVQETSYAWFVQQHQHQNHHQDHNSRSLYLNN